jgi:hypothetical protein
MEIKTAMIKKLRIPLRVVFYKDGQDWIAHALEFDLMGDAPTKKLAMDRLVQAISLQLEASLELNNPRNLFKPADGRFFAMFAAGKDIAVGEVHLKLDSITIEQADAREYSGEFEDALATA